MSINRPNKQLPKKPWAVYSYIQGTEGSVSLSQIGSVEAATHPGALAAADSRYGRQGYDYVPPQSTTEDLPFKKDFSELEVE